jgi:hypothetical protein
MTWKATAARPYRARILGLKPVRFGPSLRIVAAAGHVPVSPQNATRVKGLADIALPRHSSDFEPSVIE